MDPREVLRHLAEDKIVAASGMPLGVTGAAAARLLADVYAVGLTHGITPDDWAWVTALPDACWDASRALARLQQRVTDHVNGLNESPTVVPPAVAGRPWDQPHPGLRSSFAPQPPYTGRRGPSR